MCQTTMEVARKNNEEPNPLRMCIIGGGGYLGNGYEVHAGKKLLKTIGLLFYTNIIRPELINNFRSNVGKITPGSWPFYRFIGPKSDKIHQYPTRYVQTPL